MTVDVNFMTKNVIQSENGIVTNIASVIKNAGQMKF